MSATLWAFRIARARADAQSARETAAIYHEAGFAEIAAEWDAEARARDVWADEKQQLLADIRAETESMVAKGFQDAARAFERVSLNVLPSRD